MLLVLTKHQSIIRRLYSCNAVRGATDRSGSWPAASSSMFSSLTRGGARNVDAGRTESVAGQLQRYNGAATRRYKGCTMESHQFCTFSAVLPSRGSFVHGRTEFPRLGSTTHHFSTDAAATPLYKSFVHRSCCTVRSPSPRFDLFPRLSNTKGLGLQDLLELCET